MCQSACVRTWPFVQLQSARIVKAKRHDGHLQHAGTPLLNHRHFGWDSWIHVNEFYVFSRRMDVARLGRVAEDDAVSEGTKARRALRPRLGLTGSEALLRLSAPTALRRCPWQTEKCAWCTACLQSLAQRCSTWQPDVAMACTAADMPCWAKHKSACLKSAKKRKASDMSPYIIHRWN